MYLRMWIDTPGKISNFAIRAARFNAVIPSIDKHVTVSLLAKQLAIILRNIDGLPTLFTPGEAALSAKTAKNIANTSILNVFFASIFFLKMIETCIFKLTMLQHFFLVYITVLM